MSWVKRTFSSSIGMKAIMALTGLGLVGFVIVHLSGNLLAFAGQDVFNTCAQQIKSLGALLWVARIGLLGVFVLHVACGIQLTRLNRQARPERYRCQSTVQASLASRTMILTGLVILAFVAFHLAHYTLYWVDPAFGEWRDTQGRHDAFRMLVTGFKSPVVVVAYVIAMLLLGLHLSHGIASLFQSLGLNHENMTPAIQRVGPLLAWALTIGFMSIPLAVLAGVITYSGGSL